MNKPSNFRESVKHILDLAINRQTHKGTASRIKEIMLDKIVELHEEEIKKLNQEFLDSLPPAGYPL